MTICRNRPAWRRYLRSFIRSPGRTFDTRSAQRNEVVVNETFAKQLFPTDGGSPVGKRFRTAGNGTDVGPSPWYTIVAVTRDAAVACLVPTIRATAVDPAVAVRAE